MPFDTGPCWFSPQFQLWTGCWEPQDDDGLDNDACSRSALTEKHDGIQTEILEVCAWSERGRASELERGSIYRRPCRKVKEISTTTTDSSRSKTDRSKSTSQSSFSSLFSIDTPALFESLHLKHSFENIQNSKLVYQKLHSWSLPGKNNKVSFASSTLTVYRIMANQYSYNNQYANSPSMAGWWRCCQCHQDVNPAIGGSYCLNCSPAHAKCTSCTDTPTAAGSLQTYQGYSSGPYSTPSQYSQYSGHASTDTQSQYGQYSSRSTRDAYGQHSGLASNSSDNQYAIGNSYGSGAPTNYTRRPPTAGYWKCCNCYILVNPANNPDQCPDCTHYRCTSYCYYVWSNRHILESLWMGDIEIFDVVTKVWEGEWSWVMSFYFLFVFPVRSLYLKNPVMYSHSALFLCPDVYVCFSLDLFDKMIGDTSEVW